jgi:protein-S-isoprenylcysteine O-methyltransferase Ste14
MASSPRIAATAIIATLFYLSLAILGWGGIAAFFVDPARTALAIAAVSMGVAAPFFGGNLSSGEREDRDNRWVLAAFGVIGLVSGFVPAYTDRLDWWSFGGEALRWCGVLLFVLGGVLRLWPVRVLGYRFSGLVAIQPGHRLVTDGVYRWIRHPSYLGLLVNALGWALVFRSVVGVLLVALTLIPLVARMRAEERLLRSQFGAAYEAYCARTWRLLPWLY